MSILETYSLINKNNMKKNLTLLILFFVAIGLTAQDRYLDEVFADVEVTADVVYAVNATVLQLPLVGEAVPIPLTMDVYEPAGDTETSRPLVLVFHTGNFLPNMLNGQISGTKRDSSVVEICNLFARRGYVAASVDYRTGWNPLASLQPERALGLIQAAYRGIQDGRSAIRYFRADVEGANDFGIDESKITVFGVGTGGYLSLALTALVEYNQIILTTNPAGKFLLDLNNDSIPETPMVIQAFHGDVNGEVLTVTPPDGSSQGFGLPPGDTTNYPNSPGFANDFALSINIGGALGDISWMNGVTTPIISIQSPFDIFAPYGDAVLIVPTTGDPIVQVQGASLVGAAQEANGTNQIWKEANFDDVVTATAMASSGVAGHAYYEGTFPFVRPVNSMGIPEGVVVDWWDPNAISPAGVPWNQLPHPSGGTFHDQGLRLNENMSAEKARANINEIMSYVLPRACVALDLPCAANFTSSTEEILDNSFVKLSPNPMSTYSLIETGNMLIKEVLIFNMSGQLMKRHTNVNSNYLEINRSELQGGLYNIQIRFEEGVTTKKLLVE